MGDVDTQVAEGFSTNGATTPRRERKLDSDDLAVDLENQWRGERAYFHSTWRQYVSGYWQECQREEVANEARKFLRQYRDRGIQVTLRRAREMVGLAELELLVTDRHMTELAESQKPYINLRNGLYNTETHQLEEHRPDLYFTSQCPFDYNPKATCPTFAHYLKTSLADENGKPNRDMALLLGEAMAYSMTARVDLKASFWAIGKPETGKSKLMGLIADMNGGFHEPFDLNQLGDNRFIFAKIVGRRVVTFTEADANIMLPDALYKSLVGGGDPIRIEEKYKEAFYYTPIAKVWWAMNDAPLTKDRSGAILNRLRPIIFNRPIPDAEKITDLPARLRNEMSGIFNWLMGHYRRLQLTGQFTMPEISKKWLEDFRMRNDSFQTFINEKCVVLGDAKVSSRALYDAYRSWAMDSGFVPRNINQTTLEWERLGFGVRKIDGYPFVYGLKLRNSL